MTARLPKPGGDDNTWGDILNSYLEVSLNADGTLKTSAVSATGAEQTANKGVAGGYAQLDGSTKVPIALLPATALSSDSDVNISSPTNNQALIYNSGTSKWTNQVLPSAPVSSVAGRTGAVVLAVADVANAESTANKTTDGTLAANSDTLYPSEKAVKTYAAPAVETVHTVATSGAAQTIDLSLGTTWDITLTAACTITLPTAAAGKSFALILRQDGVGGRLVTWPGNSKWSDGVYPSLSTSSSAIDVIGFQCEDGTNWLGFPGGYGMTGGGSAETIPPVVQTALNLLAPIASPTFTGTTTAPEFTASGLTGAVAASRYVGATASGAPASGTFAIGDFIIDQTGKIWICTAAGTPGTWAQTGGAGAVSSVFTRTGAVTAQTGDYTVGQITGAAPLASPALTGHPTGVTESPGDNSTRLASTAYANRITIVRPQKPPTGGVAYLTNNFSTTGAQIPIASNNNMLLFPVDLGWSFTFDRIGCDMTIAGTGAGQVIRLGLYADDGTGTQPTGAPIFDAGTLDATATTGDKLLTIAQTLGPGRFWYAFVLQGTVSTGPTMVICNNPAMGPTMGVPNLGNQSYQTLKQTGVSAGLPSIGTLATAGNGPVLIGMRVQ